MTYIKFDAIFEGYSLFKTKLIVRKAMVEKIALA